MNFKSMLNKNKVILTEGSVYEKLKREPGIYFDPYIAHSGIIYDESGRTYMEKIYREYIDVAGEYGLPMISLAPTWRANPERILKSGYSNSKRINHDCVEFLAKIRKTYGDNSESIFIGGMMACYGDAYCPEEALTREDARSFHNIQAQELAEAGVDFIKAATLPAVSEALGMADTLAELDVPYVLSFVIRPDGTLLDGTPIPDAVNKIDDSVKNPPIFYMINCVHPSVFDQAFEKLAAEVVNRFSGFQANTSTKSPEELNNLSYLDTTEPVEFGKMIAGIHHKFGIKILGGCCGSDTHHIEQIARNVTDDRKKYRNNNHE